MKTDILSVRVPVEVKKQFIEMFDHSFFGSKRELLIDIMDKYEQKNNTVLFDETEENLPPFRREEAISYEDKVEIINEDNTEPNNLKLTISLNPVQAFALRETVLNDGFIEEVNNVVRKVDNALDTSLFGTDLYSGDYKGIFNELSKDVENEDSINKNMGKALINHFISAITFGAYDLYTPIKQVMLKDFLKNEKAVNAEEDIENIY